MPGMIKIMAERVPAAEAWVWTILFSKILESLAILRIAIEITAAGIADEKVSPTFNPRYTFDAVKISLADLKNIEDGLVVDLTSLYDNNVTLKVEDKPIASGTLVIVNDRYGVKINNVIAKGKPLPIQGEGGEGSEGEAGQSFEEGENFEEETSAPRTSASDEGAEEEEDFDYSDFELDDDNL